MGERVKFINFCQAVKKVDFISEETTRNIHNNDVIKWAFQVATTRSFEGDDNVSRIVPLGDYFDHSADAEVAMNFDGGGKLCSVHYNECVFGISIENLLLRPDQPVVYFCSIRFLGRVFAGNILQNNDSQCEQ